MKHYISRPQQGASVTRNHSTLLELAILGYELATGSEVIHTRLSKGITREAIMDRKMDLDDVLSVSVKLRGLGYLLAQDRTTWFPEDLPEIREGIGRH